MEKIVLGLSGGVDSALCARLLARQGWDVRGLYLDTGGSAGLADARRAAAELGVPLEVADIRRELYQQVVQPFVEGYLQGVTPIPCVLCNPAVKFRFLLEYADSIGAFRAATGHYAQIRQAPGGYAGLFASPAPNDQSYMLYRLSQAQLSRLSFPLGELTDKDDTRALARQYGLSAAQKPDSMEICFIPDGDYARFICGQAGQKTPPPGDFVDEQGHVLGRHKGIHCYTVGQRRGLGVPAASRLFVREIDPVQNRVILSDQWPQASTVFVHSLCRTAPDFGDSPFEAEVKIRHSRRRDRARVSYLTGDRAKIEFAQPVRAPSPGQSAVFYRGDQVVGGGYLEKLPGESLQ